MTQAGRQRRTEWLAYLHGQAAAGLARLDLVMSELAAAVANLAEIDQVRQMVENPHPVRLLAHGSSFPGQAVAVARETRERTAVALASLKRHRVCAGKEAAAAA